MDGLLLGVAVSSSGRLVVERSATTATVSAAYPGQVFAEPERAYAAVMTEFAAASLSAAPKTLAEQPDNHHQQKRALHQEQEQVRIVQVGK
jgi:hypothetical protein